MKFLRYEYLNQISYGILKEEKIYPVTGDIFNTYSVSGESIAPEVVRLLAPCEPTKIVAVGLNYRDHAAEMKEETRKTPVLFMKPSTAVLAPGASICWPEQSERVDYEAELAVVIGKTAKHVSIQEAKDYIFGYTCGNDVTARDLQKLDGQWIRGKGFDTFAPIGPVIETELDPAGLDISLTQNGKTRQRGNTNMMLFSAYELVSFISGVMTLLPGDVIFTGTPAGIGPLSKGDSVTVTISGIGSLTNSVE